MKNVTKYWLVNWSVFGIIHVEKAKLHFSYGVNIAAAEIVEFRIETKRNWNKKWNKIIIEHIVNLI